MNKYEVKIYKADEIVVNEYTFEITARNPDEAKKIGESIDVSEHVDVQAIDYISFNERTALEFAEKPGYYLQYPTEVKKMPDYDEDKEAELKQKIFLLQKELFNHQLTKK